MLSLFSTEPQMCEPDVCFQSMTELFKVLKLERQSLTSTSKGVQELMCDSCEFTEKIISEVPSARQGSVEDFQKLPLQDSEGEECISIQTVVL